MQVLGLTPGQGGEVAATPQPPTGKVPHTPMRYPPRRAPKAVTLRQPAYERMFLLDSAGDRQPRNDAATRAWTYRLRMPELPLPTPPLGDDGRRLAFVA
jgi:hypothetical protein